MALCITKPLALTAAEATGCSKFVDLDVNCSVESGSVSGRTLYLHCCQSGHKGKIVLIQEFDDDDFSFEQMMNEVNSNRKEVK